MENAAKTDASARLLACHCVAQVASASFGSIAQCEAPYLDDWPVGTGVHRPVARVTHGGVRASSTGPAPVPHGSPTPGEVVSRREAGGEAEASAMPRSWRGSQLRNLERSIENRWHHRRI